MDNSELARLIRDSHIDLKADLRDIRSELAGKADKTAHEHLEHRVRTNETTLFRAKGAIAVLGSVLTAGLGFLGLKH